MKTINHWNEVLTFPNNIDAMPVRQVYKNIENHQLGYPVLIYITTKFSKLTSKLTSKEIYKNQ